MKKITLIILLSVAEHLKDECEEQKIYVGPRFENDRNHIKVNANVKLSSIIKSVNERGLIAEKIIHYVDSFSLLQFVLEVDVEKQNIVCVIGDTHHGPFAMTRLIAWLIKNNIDKIALKQTAHHKIIFEDCGFQVTQLPYYAHDVTFIKPENNYIERVLFFGNVSHRHYRRMKLIEYLFKMNLPLDIRSGERKKSFIAHNIYACSINSPLNNDISFRIYEIMASGGGCITERLLDCVKKNQLAKDNINILEYINKDECYKKCIQVLESREKRNYIANNAYNNLYLAKKQRLVYRAIDNALTLSRKELIINEVLWENIKLFELIQDKRAKGQNIKNSDFLKLPRNWHGLLK